MTAILYTLLEQAPLLISAVTLILLVGALLGRFSAQAVEQQRWSEWSVIACLVCIPLLSTPMPRFLASASQVPRVTRVPAVLTSLPRVDPAHTPIPISAHLASATRVQSPIRYDLAARPSLAIIDVNTFVNGLGILYLLGAALCALRLLMGLACLRKILRAATPSPALAKRLHAKKQRRPIRVLLTDDACRPFCCGLLRPTIVLPRALEESASLDTVLDHELAHLDRRDPWSHALFALAAPLLWPHPLFWLLRNRARLCAELIADSLAARATSKTDYARRLLDLVELDAVRPSAPIPAVPVFGRPSELAKRIEMLMQRDKKMIQRTTTRHRLSRTLTSAVVMTLAVGVFGATPASAQDPGQANVAQLKKMNRILRTENAKLRVNLNALASRVDALSKSLGAAGDRLEASKTVTKVENSSPNITAKRGDPLTAVDVRRLVDDVSSISEKVANGEGVLGRFISDEAALSSLDRVLRQVARDTPATQPDRSTMGTVALINDFLDAKLELSEATHRHAQLVRALKQSLTTRDEVRTAEIRVRTAAQRHNLIRTLVQGELNDFISALARQKDTLSRSHKLAKKGFVSSSTVHVEESKLRRLLTRVGVLKAALKN